MIRGRARLAGGAAALALAVSGTGCGGSDSPPPADPATVAPRDTALYLDATIHPEGDVKASLSSALSKLLGTRNVGRYVTARVNVALAKDNLSYSEDVASWLGERGAIFYQSFGEHPKAAVVLQTTDPGAALDTFAKVAAADHRKPTETTYRGVTLESAADDSYAAIGDLVVGGPLDGVKAAIAASAGRSLADSDTYRSSLADSPSDRVFTAWADPKAVTGVSMARGEETGHKAKQILALEGRAFKEPIAAWGDASSDYLALELSLAGTGSAAAGSPLEDLPSDAWLAFGAHSVGEEIARAIKQLQLATRLGSSATLDRVRAALGVDVGDLSKWVGDVSGYIGGTSIINLNGALVATTRDPAASAKSLAQLEDLFKRDIDVVTRPLGEGRTGFSVTPQGAPVQFVFEQRGGKVVAGLGEDSVDAVVSPSKTLADSPAFKAASGALAGLAPSLYFDFDPIASVLNIPGVSTNPNLELAKPYLDRLDYLIAGGGVKDGRTLTRIVLGVKSASSDSGDVAAADGPAYAAVGP